MKKRIFICSHRSLFSEGVEAFLLNDPELQVVGWETDPEAAVDRINEAHPDIVLLIGDQPYHPCVDARCLLRQTVEANVVTLNLQADRVRVFRGEQYVVTEMHDLLEVIKQSMAASP